MLANSSVILDAKYPGDIFETRMLDFKTEDIGYVIFYFSLENRLVQFNLSSYFSYGQFCELVCEMFPELVSTGGWGSAPRDPKNILLLFLDSDEEIIRIRNGILFFEFEKSV